MEIVLKTIKVKAFKGSNPLPSAKSSSLTSSGNRTFESILFNKGG